MGIKVPLVWDWLEWKPGYTWTKNIVPQLRDAGVNVKNLNRCVYVIRVNGIFAISYPNKISPVIYIGEGKFWQRLSQHKRWLGDIGNLVHDYSFEIGIAIPRVKNSPDTYRDCEAALILKFRDIYGAAPLANKQIEKRMFDYEYSERGVKEALQIGKGFRYHWAIKPMPASSLYKDYHKTIIK